MNDPGAEKPISEAADEVAPVVEDDSESERHRQSDYHDPTRWWFASTGCPLAAGTLGPLASTFNICSLVDKWRVYLPPDVPANAGIPIDDPTWVIALNVMSLLSALIANILLLLNMTQHVRFKIAQPVCICGFFFASILLIADMVALTASPTYRIAPNSPAAPAVNHALGAAFYYAVQAAVLYFLVASLMCLTALGAYKGHFPANFRLSPAQRTLMLQTMAFFTYLLLGALVFSHVEGWAYLNAVYWADLTLLTIGLGSDFHPSTHTGRTLLLFFAIGGIVIIGLVIGSIRSLALEAGARKISARLIEKKRKRAIASVDPRTHRIRISRFKTIHFDNDDLDPAHRRRLEFNVMRAVLGAAESDRRWMALMISTSAALVLWLIGAVVFMQTEYRQTWSYFDCLYFSYTTLLTIGYGDFYPVSNSGRAFFVLWTLLAVPTLTVLISDMSATVVASFSSFVISIGSYTVLPEGHTKESFRSGLKQLAKGHLHSHKHDFTKNEQTRHGHVFQIKEAEDNAHQDHKSGIEQHDGLKRNLLDRLAAHLEDEELDEAQAAEEAGDTLERDVHFYHLVLAREIRSMLHDLHSNSNKRYSWGEWEYFLKLAGADNDVDDHNEDDPARLQLDHSQPDDDESRPTQSPIVPEAMRSPRRVGPFVSRGRKQHFSWLSDQSPLMADASETEWILGRLSIALDCELAESRRAMKRRQCGLDQDGDRARRRPPPISLDELVRSGQMRGKGRRRDDRRDSEDQHQNQGPAADAPSSIDRGQHAKKDV